MTALVISCEHGGNHVPARYAHLFRGARRVLASHRGYDPGTLEIARYFARRRRAPLALSTVTRLLVELNRSPEHPRLFSEFTRNLDRHARSELLDEYYFPYRQRLESLCREQVERHGRVLHLAMHSFTPVLNGSRRNADVGLLYDPVRKRERQFCEYWRASLREHRPDLVVRRNYPYQGQSDGMTTWLRRRFGSRQYAGVELEVNQRFPLGPSAAWKQLQHDLLATFLAARATE